MLVTLIADHLESSQMRMKGLELQQFIEVSCNQGCIDKSGNDSCTDMQSSPQMQARACESCPQQRHEPPAAV